MITGTEERIVRITNARSCWTEKIRDEEDFVKVVKLIQSELYAGNTVGLIVAVEKKGLPSRTSLSFDEE